MVHAYDNEQKIYEHPTELLQNLIRFDTSNPPGNEGRCITYIDELLTKAGIKTTLLSKTPDRPNLIARLKGRGDAPPLLMQGHVDVMPVKNQKWTYPPFEGKKVDGYIWGRGALDMKGGVAMMLAAFLRAKAEKYIPAGDIVFAALCDEEALSNNGAKYLVKHHPEQFEGIRHAIGEFGSFSYNIGRHKFYLIQVAEKQICHIRATISGPGGHGGLHMRGGTMAKLARFLFQLDQKRLPVHITPVVRLLFEGMAAAFPSSSEFDLCQILDPTQTDGILDQLDDVSQIFDPWFHNSINATIVQGGTQFNVIPSEVVVDLDTRILPGISPEEMFSELKDIIDDDVQLELIRHDPGPSEPNMDLFDTLANILRESDPEAIPIPYLSAPITDARFFSQLGIQTYGFLPMNMPVDFNFSKYIHAADERIPVDAVNFGANAIYKLIQRYSGV